MADAPVLRINDVPFGGQRRVEVSWQDGPARQVAVSAFSYHVDDAEAEKVRWYLEDYAEFPADPGPRLAVEAESEMAETGTGLFSLVFAGMDAAGIWAAARPRLGRVRVEVDADPSEVPGLPWELLRDPGTGTALALSAGTFVRTHLQAAQAGLPQPGGDRLRVLLVICRPGRGDDVPFRSVASRLARGGAAAMEGLDLDVLRPATFARLETVLHEAADAGRPYHVVHFDGHGTYLDVADLEPGEDESDSDDGPAPGMAGGAGSAGGVRGVSPLRYGLSVAGPVRAGQHGYLIFEDPGSRTNQQLVDGPALGRVLTATGVPVLVLNACRSAYTEASSRPGPPEVQPGSAAAGTNTGDGAAGAGLTTDVHARIRAYGSLAAEVADAGVPGVVAMRYSVYVVTAAQYAADLYAHLLAGRSLGEAATAARRALAADPTRQIGAAPVALQDWAVPVVYEAAPLTLLPPGTRDAPLIQVSTADRDGAGAAEGLPRPPDAGFFGRDETLLALDRAFDTQRLVLLEAFAGAGKSTTAAEFARWYQATGGLDYPGHPEWGPGAVLWASFEHHLPLDKLIGTAGDLFSAGLEASGLHWQAITDPARRRDLMLQILARVPVLWVWDNTEPVTGFPPGTQSAWSPAEQDELADFLRDLAQRTRCKVLLTSRRDEQAWLGGLPARLQLPPMPMRERLQLAAAIAERHGHPAADINWRPLLRFSAGNPLAITVLVGQAVRDNLTTTGQIEAFVARLRAGEAELEPGEDAALGRTQSLAASLSYGFSHAFTPAERAQLAVLHLFRDTIDADALRLMGDPGTAGDDAVPQLAGLTRESAIELLDRAAAIGLLSPLGEGYYAIHPALPWYFTTLYGATYGQPDDPAAQSAARAYTHTLAALGNYYHHQATTGAGNPVPALRAEEANLQHALALARQAQHWYDALGCLQGLSILYTRTGRDGEWARLVAGITADFIDPATDGPPPGREDEWTIFTQYRVEIARAARDWPAATRLQHASVAWDRDQAAAALAAPSSQLTPAQRNELRNLAIALQDLGRLLRDQADPGCLASFEEALGLFQRIGARTEEARVAIHIGNAYAGAPGPLDLDQAEHWYRYSLDRWAAEDRLGRAQSLASLAHIAYQRFLEGREAGEPAPVLLDHLNAALAGHKQALSLISADDAEELASSHNQIGLIYRQAGDTRQALHHFQQSIKYEEARGDLYGAGNTRYNIALLLEGDGRPGDALHYVRAALHNYERTGPGAAQNAAQARDLIARLEQQVAGAT
ncbi:MAG TPA: CHAT domain-containing protein [Streptosporangiaceae bacterium]|nr:CHAT domain-containing protein [Streptosporangiaceae bacterium]